MRRGGLIVKRKVLAALTASVALAAPATAAATSQSGPVEHVVQRAGSSGGHIAIEGNRLYMGMYGEGVRIFDTTKPDDPTEIGRWTPADAMMPAPVADGPPDAAVFDGRHIAVVNGTDRTSEPFPEQARTDQAYFLDTTDPANIQLLWRFQGPEDGESHNGDIVDSRRLWIASGAGGENGLRIYDLNPLLQNPPAAPAAIFRGDPAEMWAASPHLGNKDPGDGFTHTHDMTIYPDLEVGGVKRDILLLAEGGSYTNDSGNTGSVFVIDITNPRAPVVLQRWLHASGDGHHPIRYYHEAQFLHGDPRLMLVTDEDLHNGCTAGGVTAVRLSEDLTQATEVSEWFIADQQPAGTAFGPICSVHVFSSHGQMAYFGSYNAGLQVVDFSNPGDPKLAAHNQQPGANSWGAEYGRDGLIYVGDMGSRGLDVFRYTGPMPDLTVAAPTLSDGSGSARLDALVTNQGKFASGSVPFEFRDGDRLAGRATVPPLAPGATHRVQAKWDIGGARGARQIAAVVDAGDRLDESDEQNNSGSATIGAPAAATTSPLSATLKVRRTRLKRALRRGLTLSVSCTRACRGRVALQLNRRVARKLKLGRKTVVIGRKTFALPQGATKSLRVRMTKRARRALRRTRAVKLTAVLRVTDPAGAGAATVRRAVRLRR